MSDLPPGWCFAPVGDLGDLKLGKMLDRAKNQGLPTEYLRNINVRWFRFDLEDMHTIFVSEAELEQFAVEDGDLFVCEGGEPGRCAVWRRGDNAFVYQKALHRFRAHGVIVPELLMYRLRHEADSGALADAFTGTTIKHLTRESLAAFRVPVPPFNEQKRIVDKLDTLLARVDACRERLDRVPALLKRFRQSVLAAATSGELTREWREERGLVLDWEESTLGSVGAITGGITKNAGRANTSLMKRYLRVANVYANRLSLENIAEIATTPEEFARTQLRTGDVLIVEGNGSIEQIGRAALWRGELGECAHQNHLIRWRSRGSVLPEFALYWLLSPAGRQSLVEFAKSSAGLHTLSLSKVSAVPLAVPLLDEQAEVVRRVSELLGLAERFEQRAREAQSRVESVTQSALGKAFRGELVPQDPNDEPASELLARLRSTATSADKPSKAKRGPKRGKAASVVTTQP